MATIASLVVELSANVARLQSDMARASATVGAAVGDIQSQWKRLERLIGGGAAVTAVYQFGAAAVTAAREAEQAAVRLETVLRATEHAAGRTKTQIDELADSMSRTTQFDDESIRNAAATFLKFGNIQTEVFDRAMAIAADYAAFTGSAIPDAAQTIGRALQSPVDGLTMMQRQIGKLRPEQEALIKQFMDVGNVAAAQAVVLDALAGKIGGTAEAMNTGLTRATTGARKAWDEFLESFGKAVPVSAAVQGGLTAVEVVLNSLKDVAGAFSAETWSNAFKHGIFKPPVDEAALRQAREAAARATQSARDAKWDEDMAKQIEAQRKFAAELAARHAREQKALRERQAAEQQRLTDQAHAAHQRGVEEALTAEYDAYHDQTRALNDLRRRQAEERAALDRKIQEGEEAALAARVAAAEDRYYSEQRAIAENQKRLLKEQEDEAKKGAEAARQLGLTFASAFEDSIVKGMAFRDMLQGLAQDVLRLATRKLVTEPAAAMLSSFFDTSMKSLFGPGKASGGYVAPGMLYPVNEARPELLSVGGRDYLMMGAQGGMIDPRPGGGGGSGLTVYADMRGASESAVVRLEALVARLDGSIEQRAAETFHAMRTRSVAFG